MTADRKAILAVFALATVVRLAFLFGVDQPLLYTHQYTYFTNGLRLAEHPDPIDYILRSDEWRTWDESWTIAPLYYLFLGGLFKLFGPHLVPIQIVQCLLGGASAAGVALLGRAVAGRAGILAGLVYALYGPAIEMPSTTMTENVHTPLFIGGMLLLAGTSEATSRKRSFSTGIVLGLSALARSVSTGFLGLGALYLVARDRRRGFLPAVLVLAGGAAAILPWTARNFLLVGDGVLIESAAFENLWYANALVDRARFEKQLSLIREQASPATRRSTALHFALRGIRRSPWGFAEKVKTNFWHLLRPEGLQNLLRIERSQEAWRHAVSLVLDDLPFLLALPAFLVFVVAGRASPARAMILLWIGYYLLMIVVVFHNEIRYRSALVPFLFAGAAGVWPILRDSRRPRRAWIAAAVGVWLVLATTAPYAAPAWRATRAAWAMRPALAALEGGHVAEAETLTAQAAALDPRSPRPWLTLGRRLAAHGHTENAQAAYERAHSVATPASWSTRLVRPALWHARQRPEADAALAAAHALSWATDPWLALEVAWRELPAPHTDKILVGHDDYGAVRGFLYPRGGDPERDAHRLEWNLYEQLGFVLPPPGTHRWSRHRAWLRLRPTSTSPRYTATLTMSVAFPSPLTTAAVDVLSNDGSRHHFTVDRTIRDHRFDVAPGADGTIVVRIDAPTWNLAGEPAEQAVRVDRFAVQPLATP